MVSDRLEKAAVLDEAEVLALAPDLLSAGLQSVLVLVPEAAPASQREWAAVTALELARRRCASHRQTGLPT